MHLWQARERGAMLRDADLHRQLVVESGDVVPRLYTEILMSGKRSSHATEDHIACKS
jgi:hypothetical protein